MMAWVLSSSWEAGRVEHREAGCERSRFDEVKQAGNMLYPRAPAKHIMVHQVLGSR